jgi:hypothetical protein
VGIMPLPDSAMTRGKCGCKRCSTWRSGGGRCLTRGDQRGDRQDGVNGTGRRPRRSDGGCSRAARRRP